VWRSPAGQPAWARPALLVVAALAALAYSWQVGSTIEIFYAAAVRSMTQSWHNVLFGAFDPAGTITVDKLPGALWVQALSARLFGIHPWALAIPQVLEGLVSILLLFSTVRRLRGPGVALLASGILAVAPASTALDRGNISDSLLIESRNASVSWGFGARNTAKNAVRASANSFFSWAERFSSGIRLMRRKVSIALSTAGSECSRK